MHLLKNFKELTVRPKNAQELKGLILQLAIQGKLTDHWRKQNNDAKLDTEKLIGVSKKSLAFLIKESNSINQLDVPSSWLKLKFKTIFEMQGGSQPPKSMFSTTKKEGYIQLYQIRDFGKRPVPVYVPKDSVSKLCTEKDIMIGRYGASIGKIFYGKKGAYNVALVRLIWNRELLEQNFVYQIFSSYYMQEFFQNCTRSAQAGFNKTDMGKLNIPIPPLEEQKAIVEIVESLFKEVEQLEQLTIERISLKEDFVTSALNQFTSNNTKQEWAFLQEHFKSFFNENNNIKKLRETVLQLAVQGKLTADWRTNNPETEDASVLLKRIQKEKAQLVKDKKIKKEKALPEITKDEIPYELPKGWGWCRPYEISVNIVDCPHSTAKFVVEGKACIDTTCMDDNGGLKYSKIRKVSDETFNKRNDRLIPKAGDIIYAREGSIGKSIVIPEGLDVCLGQRVMIYRLHKLIDPYLFRYILVSPMFMKQVLGNHKGLGAKHVNMSDLRSMPIPLIPSEEQIVITNKINTLMGLCDRLEQQVQQGQVLSEKLMESVLREVFEGKKEVVKN